MCNFTNMFIVERLKKIEKFIQVKLVTAHNSFIKHKKNNNSN